MLCSKRLQQLTTLYTIGQINVFAIESVPLNRLVRIFFSIVMQIDVVTIYLMVAPAINFVYIIIVIIEFSGI